MNFNYDSIPAGYYDLVYKARAGIRSAWHHHKFSYVRNKIIDTGSHLDIGCGPGTFLGNYNFKSAVGVDLVSAQVDYANKNYSRAGLDFIKTDKKLPFEDGTFGSISIIEVIEHLDNDSIQLMLREAVRVLSPGGKLIVTTPNYRSFWPIMECIVNLLSDISYEDQHITKLTHHRLSNLFHGDLVSDLRVESFLLFSPFIAGISWRAGKFFMKIDRILCRTGLGFLLYAVCTKKYSTQAH